ncbi:MAG: hypothetical protein QXQ41_03535 [Candidatus Bathyarchaeia archaeon]
MSSIYKIKPSGEFLEVERAPFSDETKELESFIMKNERILGNVVLLNRQVILPDGKRIDIWGLDTLDLCPVIVELKNVSVGIEVIPQILPYYSFVKSNPDSLKFRAISEEKFMSKLASFEIDREKLDRFLEEDPKVILVAPKFNKDLLDVVDYFKIKIELVEIYRYKTDAGETLVMVNKPQLTEPVKATVRVMEDWNWEKYQKVGISEKKIEVAKGLKEKIDNIIKNEKIPVEPIFRKLYIPYQSGRSNVFWIDLGYTSWTTGDVRIGFYLDKEPNLEAEGIKIEHTKTRWEEGYNQWSIFFNKPVDLSALTPIIKKSYEYVTGQKLE